jgi:hypothetical protein
MSLKNKLKLGATGDFPDGKLDQTDEGELALEVCRLENGLVRIGLGPPGRLYEVCAASPWALAKYFEKADFWAQKIGACKVHRGRTHYRVVNLTAAEEDEHAY